MATTTGDSQEKHGEKEIEPSFWATFSRGDARLFVVTFAGTVAANVVTVVVVAVALILARPANSGPHTIRVVLPDIAYAVLGVPIVWFGLITFRRRRPTRDPLVIRVVSLFVIVGMGLMTLLFMLVLLGFAVGVK